MPRTSPSLSRWTRDKVAQSQEELLQWTKHLNLGIQTNHWRVLDKASEPNRQRLILFIEQQPYTIIGETEYKIFTGLSQGTIKVLRDTETKPQLGEWGALESVSSETTPEDWEGGGLMN
jgi:hypothetical protein